MLMPVSAETGPGAYFMSTPPSNCLVEEHLFQVWGHQVLAGTDQVVVYERDQPARSGICRAPWFRLTFAQWLAKTRCGLLTASHCSIEGEYVPATSLFTESHTSSKPEPPSRRIADNIDAEIAGQAGIASQTRWCIWQ
jgi:hypothetical protein